MKKVLYIGLLILYLSILTLTIRLMKYTPDPSLQYYHPFNQWWRRKETNLSNWYQDHFFDSKRRDNLFPTYQNI
jgi:hypothetical protein